jgi:AcrR family transcriptional regulator
MMTLTSDQHKIIDAAFKRFSKYGHENTTMASIAKDLGYSRTFLYYYFQDKESIFKAALIRRTDRYFEALEKEFKKKTSGINMLEALLKAKIGCAKDFQSLGVYTNITLFRMILNDPDLKYIFTTELKMVSRIIQDGIKDGTIKKCHSAKTAAIIVDGLHGFMSVGLRKLTDTKISQKDLEDLYKKQLEFGTFLVQGIKKD